MSHFCYIVFVKLSDENIARISQDAPAPLYSTYDPPDVFAGVFSDFKNILVVIQTKTEDDWDGLPWGYVHQTSLPG